MKIERKLFYLVSIVTTKLDVLSWHDELSSSCFAACQTRNLFPKIFLVTETMVFYNTHLLYKLDLINTHAKVSIK